MHSSSSSEEDTACKIPFAAERRAAKTKLAKARRSGDEVAEADAMLTMGELLLRSARYSKALARARTALDFFPQAVGQAEAARLMIRVHLAERNFQDAIKLVEEKLAFFRGLHEARATAIVMLTSAEVQMELDRPKEALKLALTALADLSRDRDRAWESTALQTTARVRLKLGKREEARKALLDAEKALKFFQSVGDYKEEADTLLLISRLHVVRHEFEDAHLFARTSVELSQKHRYVGEEAAAWRQLASVILASQGDPETAGTKAKHAANKCRQNGDMLGEIAAKQTVASAYQAEGLINLALEAMNEALALARTLNDRHLIEVILESQMKIYEADGEGSLEVMREEAGLARRVGDMRREVSATQKIASLQLLQGNQSEALQAAEEVIEISRVAEDVESEARAFQLVAEVHKGLHEFEEALDAALYACSLLRDFWDVRCLAAALQVLANIYEDMGNDKQAMAVLVDQRKAYEAVGWKREEAEALLSRVELTHRKRGVLGAVDVVNQAIRIYEEMDDEAGKADALIVRAKFQMANPRTNKDAEDSLEQAQQIYKVLEDSIGQAQAWQTLAYLHLDRGAPEKALQMSRNAWEVCQHAGDKKAEAKALGDAASVREALVHRQVERGLTPPPEVMQDAISWSMESLESFQQAGDQAAQASALLQLVGLYQIDDDSDSALSAAKECLELCMKLGDLQLESRALMAVAEVQLALGDGEEATQAAKGAMELFEHLGDLDSADRAARLVEAARDPPRPQKLAGRGRSAFCDGREGRRSASEATVALPAPRPTSSRRAGGAYSSMVESLAKESADEKRRKELLREPLRPVTLYDTPDQDLRKQQLAMAAEEVVSPAGTAAPTLMTALQRARPEWNAKDLQAVQEKFAKIEITSLEELFQQLRIEGAHGVNTRLKNAGQKGLKPSTLTALQEQDPTL